MNMQLNSGARVRRDAKIGRWLKLIIAAVLFAGLFMQITMLSRISAQNKKASSLEKEISDMQANVDNLERSISDYHNLHDIENRALSLGMQLPEDGQIRVVCVAQTQQDTPAQMASIAGSEE